jgi:hypothetical protein
MCGERLGMYVSGRKFQLRPRGTANLVPEALLALSLSLLPSALHI